MIINKSDRVLTIADFVLENPELIIEYQDQYCWTDAQKVGFTQDKLLKSAEQIDMVFQPGEHKYCVFGDEDGTLIGRVFDYILRDGGSSRNFDWRFHKFLR